MPAPPAPLSVRMINTSPVRAVCALVLCVGLLAAGPGLRAAARRADGDPVRIQAAQIMARALASIRALRLEKRLPIDPMLDPNRTGIIGDEFTPLTTSLGEVDDKRTSANPAFAAIVSRIPARGRCRARRRDRGRRQRLVPRAAAGHAVRLAGPRRRADRHLLGRFLHVRCEPAGLHVRGHARAPAPRRRAAVPPGRGLAGRRRGCRARRAVRRGRRLAAGGDAAHRHSRSRGRFAARADRVAPAHLRRGCGGPPDPLLRQHRRVGRVLGRHRGFVGRAERPGRSVAADAGLAGARPRVRVRGAPRAGRPPAVRPRARARQPRSVQSRAAPAGRRGRRVRQQADHASAPWGFR